MASPDNSQFEPLPQKPDQAVPALPAETSFTVPHDGGVPGSGPVAPTPIENPIWSGWDVLLIAALTFVVVVLLQLASAKVAQLLWYPRMSVFQAEQQVEKRPTLLILSQIVLYIPVALLMIATVEGKYHVSFWRAVGWNWPRATWKWIAVGAALLLSMSMLENLLPMPKDTPFEHLFDRPLDSYLVALLAVTLAPLMEELFFRGLLYPVLARRIGMFWGVLLSALPFALLHLPEYADAWAAGLVILIVGIVCGVVRATTRSVGASVLVHAGYNGTQMLIAIAFTRGFTHMPKGFLDCCSR